MFLFKVFHSSNMNSLEELGKIKKFTYRHCGKNQSREKVDFSKGVILFCLVEQSRVEVFH